MTFEAIMKLWTLIISMTAINQIKTTGTFVFDRYFKSKGKQTLGTTATIKIKKGASVVLNTITAGADRDVKNLDKIYELTIKLPRFGLSDQILASEINEFESLQGKAKAEAVSKRITEILTDHKNDYMTTLEYMSTGALFGHIVDGEGKTLLEFKTTAEPIDFKDKSNIEALDAIDEALVDELGKEVPYEILASASFITKVAAEAKKVEAFKTKEAEWIDEGGKRILMYHSKKYIPFRASWTDEEDNKHQFIKDNEAVVIPLSTDVFDYIYGRADHTEALGVAPKLFFAAQPEKLEKGKGWGLETEMKAIPFCTRPGALIKLKFS